MKLLSPIEKLQLLVFASLPTVALLLVGAGTGASYTPARNSFAGNVTITGTLTVTGDVVTDSIKERTTGGLMLTLKDDADTAQVSFDQTSGVTFASSTAEVTAPRLRVGGGAQIRAIDHGVATINFASTASGACSTAAITNAAAADADFCEISRDSSADVVGSLDCHSNAGGMTAEYCNESASVRDPGSQDFPWFWIDRT